MKSQIDQTRYKHFFNLVTGSLMHGTHYLHCV